MHKNTKPRLFQSLSMIDKLRADLFYAAPDEEMDILNHLGRELQIARGITVSAIAGLKAEPCGSD